MSSKKLLQQVFGLMLAVFLLAGCGSSNGGEAAKVSTADKTATATLSAGAPCFGLIQADKLPDWAGSLAFGKKHSLGGNNFVDLTSMVGCKVEGGVILIEDGRFVQAYVNDCKSLKSSNISPQELRPGSGDSWVCVQPTGDGGIQFVQREG